jgi:hypothetical protein
LIEIRPARLGEAAYVGRNLREEDAREVFTATQRLPERVVVQSFKISRECLAVYRRGLPVPVALFGVADDPHTEGLGVVWMLCTDEVLRVSKTIIRQAPQWLDTLSRHYPLGVHNYADLRNYHHVRWCRLSGFEELGSVDVAGHPFIHIYRPTHV